MAEGVVSFFLQNLANLPIEEGRFLCGVEGQIKSLQDELQFVRSFLRDADKKRLKFESVKAYVSQIRDVAYDAEDAIEMFVLNVERQRMRSIPISSLVGCICQLPSIHKLGSQIVEIKKRLEEISKNKLKYGIDDLQPTEFSGLSNEAVSRRESRAPIVEVADVVGFKKEEEKLAKQLLDHGGQQLNIVSIVGMGGLGKTTLAKKIYNRSDVKNHFDCCAWITVSQEFRIIYLLESIVKQVMVISEDEKRKLGEKWEEELRSMLNKHFQEKNYLLVFDDVWRTEDWDRLKEAFLVNPTTGKQGRVLLTTRKEDVAKHANPLSIDLLKLRLLDENESLELFVKVVFRGRNFSEELQSLGKEIVGKCGGLPLAIIVLGGLLSTKDKTVHEWKKLLDNADWQLTQGSDQCSQVFVLSYTDLPYYLKSCFLYVGLFPEDHVISATQLVQLWVAEGFAKQRGVETMEDVAEDYLEDLIQRSMVQVEERRYDGRIESCRVHDLLREFAILEAKQDKFLDVNSENNNLASPNGPRRLGILGKYSETSNDNYLYLRSNVKQLRSLLWFPKEIRGNLWKNMYKNFKLIRVLELRGTNIKSLPKEIGQLFFLKYLGLDETRILRKLPHSMHNLRNVQTLNLWRTGITSIPSFIWKLRKLRHLRIGEFCGIKSMVHCRLCGDRFLPRINHLRDLQTLHLEASNWINGGLEYLTNLRDLCIHGDLRPYAKVISESIIKLEQLRKLCFEWTDIIPFISYSRHVHLYHLTFAGTLEKLGGPHCFPPNLTELTLWRTMLEQEDAPMAVFEKLPNLRKLVLRWASFFGASMTCSVQGFPKLQHLEISELDYLEDWIVEKGAMPNLTYLQIYKCPKLKMLPDGLKDITTLQKLELVWMPSEFNARVQEDGGEDWDKIKHIPNLVVQSIEENGRGLVNIYYQS